MPQVFTVALSYFSQIIHQDLSTLQFPGKSTLLQYVDDFLLCSVTKEESIKDFIYLLQQWTETGSNVSKEKLQLSLDTVHYLVHSLNAERIQLSSKRMQLIQEFPRPTARWQLHGFLGLAGYCRLWVPNFSLFASPLYELTKLSIPEPLPWEDKHEQAFIRLKQALQEPPALGLPNYSKPFIWFVHERDHQALWMLTQEHGNKHRPVAYYNM